MTTTTSVQQVPEVGGAPEAPSATDPVGRGRVRFVRAVVVGLVAVGIPYLWILWDLWTGTFNALRSVSPSDFYDLQGHAMLSGRFSVPDGSLGIEAFLHDGHQYTYFGIFPSIIRLPVLALTHSFDGRLTAPSMLAAWVVTGVLASLLLWRVRIQIRGEAVVGVAEAVCCGILVAAVNGSVLLYLAASPKVSHEDLAWSVALTLGALFALVGVAERPSGRRMALCAIFVVCAALDRSPTGYACIVATLLVAGWFGLGRGGSDRRRSAVPLVVIAVGALVLDGVVNWAKLGMPFGLSEANQVWTQVNAHRRLYLASNGGNAFALHYLPSTLVAYLQPFGISVSTHFPFFSLPTGVAGPVGTVVLDQTYPTASVPASWPLLFVLGVWGVVTAFRPHPVGRVQPLRLLLVATAAGTAGVLLFGYIADRYLADFLPFFALAAMIGMVDVWRRFDGRDRRARSLVVAVAAVLGVFGLWVNIGAAVTPSAQWTTAQAKAFVSLQRSLGGTPAVERGATLPYWAPAGTLFAPGDCSGLYVSTGFDYSTVPGEQLEHETWDTVEEPADSVHYVQVTWDGPVVPGGPPVTVATYGTTRVELEPTGTDRVRLAVRGPDLPDLSFPPTTTAPVTVEPGKPYNVEIVTDPELHSIVAGGIGVGVQYPLPGTGPFALGAGPGITVVGRSRGTAPSNLCRQLAGSSGRR